MRRRVEGNNSNGALTAGRWAPDQIFYKYSVGISFQRRSVYTLPHYVFALRRCRVLF
jgi:hypothetical protein